MGALDIQPEWPTFEGFTLVGLPGIGVVHLPSRSTFEAVIEVHVSSSIFSLNSGLLPRVDIPVKIMGTIIICSEYD